ncbi:hypothetical protein Salat_1848500, partial [Sesamum alatum]
MYGGCREREPLSSPNLHPDQNRHLWYCCHQSSGLGKATSYNRSLKAKIRRINRSPLLLEPRGLSVETSTNNRRFLMVFSASHSCSFHTSGYLVPNCRPFPIKVLYSSPFSPSFRASMFLSL